jgi:hypothetical protein
MNYEVVLDQAANLDLFNSFSWYEMQRTGLGYKFLPHIKTILTTLESAPELYPTVHKNIRRALINRFPFGVFYIIENSSISIIAVLHDRRDPNLWKTREL